MFFYKMTLFDQTGIFSSLCAVSLTAILSLYRQNGRYYKQTYTAAYHKGVCTLRPLCALE